MNILKKIIAHKQEEVKSQSKIIPLERLQKSQRLFAVRDFKKAMEGEDIRIIAEIKRQSPSEKNIYPNADPAEVAKSYQLNGAAALSVLTDSHFFGGHLDFGDRRRYWDFRSLGHGDIDFEEIIRALNRIKYTGPLSVEWEDSGMDRDHGAEEACEYVQQVDFDPSDIAFDAAFEE